MNRIVVSIQKARRSMICESNDKVSLFLPLIEQFRPGEGFVPSHGVRLDPELGVVQTAAG